MANTLKLPGIVKVSPGLRYWSEVGLPCPSTSRTGPGSTILCLVGVPSQILTSDVISYYRCYTESSCEVSPTLIEELVGFPF